MTAGHSGALPQYDQELVERAFFDEVLDLHPRRLTVAELSARIVGDPGDGREVEVAADAIHGLRASSLVRYRDEDQVVEATRAALRVCALLDVY